MGLVFIVYGAEMEPGPAKAYPDRAAASLATTKTALQGAMLYDIFQTPDGSCATVIETYESSEALVRHMGALAKAAAPPMQTTSTSLTLLGDLSDELKTKFTGHGGRYFGPRRMGLMERWRQGQVPVGDASAIVMATFRNVGGRWCPPSAPVRQIQGSS